MHQYALLDESSGQQGYTFASEVSRHFVLSPSILGCFLSSPLLPFSLTFLRPLTWNCCSQEEILNLGATDFSGRVAQIYSVTLHEQRDIYWVVGMCEGEQTVLFCWKVSLYCLTISNLLTFARKHNLYKLNASNVNYSQTPLPRLLWHLQVKK